MASPYACVMTFLPSIVTRTIAARTCWLAMTARTTRVTIAAWAGRVDAAVEPVEAGGAVDAAVHAVPADASRHATSPARRARCQPDECSPEPRNAA
jgi:hypothetical protein